MQSRSQRRWLPDGLPHQIGWRWWIFLTAWLLTLAAGVVGAALAIPGLVARVGAPPSPNGLIGPRTTLPADEPNRLIRDRRDPLFPMRVPLHAEGVGLVGQLLLGPCPDGTIFGREDRAALGAIASPVARALAVALARERSEAARAAREQRLQDQIDDLRSALHARAHNDAAFS